MLPTGTSPTLASTLDIKVPAQKMGVPFGPSNPRQKSRRFHTQVEGNNLRSINSQHCFGLQIPLRCKPVQFSLPIASACRVNAHLIDADVESLLSKGAIVQVSPLREGFFSRLFLVPKKGGALIPAIFRWSLSLIRKGDYMTTLDLKDAYLSVPVHKDSQKFLHFLWRDKFYAFQGLCFGLNSTPRVFCFFTKLLKPAAAHLRKRGVRMILDLDAFFIVGSSYQEDTAIAIALLANLGFTVNREKSCLIPTQPITFLGFVIDSSAD